MPKSMNSLLAPEGNIFFFSIEFPLLFETENITKKLQFLLAKNKLDVLVVSHTVLLKCQ